MAVDQRPGVERIGETTLASLVEREFGRSAATKRSKIRNPLAFAQHLVEVATRAELVARLLAKVVPQDEAPDPTACFVAGAWHDGGKISNGDDYHELASAADILDRGLDWGLVQGASERAEPVLHRAARAVLSDFAMYEQWQPPYRPTSGDRTRFATLHSSIASRLVPWSDERTLDRQLFLPYSLDALVVIYADITANDPELAVQDGDEAADQVAWRLAEATPGAIWYGLDGERCVDGGRRLDARRRFAAAPTPLERRSHDDRRRLGDRRRNSERRQSGFDLIFKRRWVEIARRAQTDDPALWGILPGIRPRIYDGCALVDAFLKRGYDQVALRSFRLTYC